MTLSTPATAPTDERALPASRDHSRAQLRARLVQSAITQFATHGFEGASTRAIAEGAGAHQPQINYHFDNKENLWRAALEQLLSELDDLLSEPSQASDVAMETTIRVLVTFGSRRPELNQILIHEGANPGPRLAWLVDTHLRTRSQQLRSAWEHAVAAGIAADVPSDLVYHTVLGASALVYANAPEARLLFATDPTDPDQVQAHADAMVRLFLPGITQRNQQ